MDIEIRQINDDENEIGLVQDFLYDQIKKEYVDCGDMSPQPTYSFHF